MEPEIRKRTPCRRDLIKHSLHELNRLHHRSYMGNTPSEGAMHHLPTDIVDFLEGYPYHRAEDEDTSSNYNLLFYSNQCASMPDNLLIDEFHEQCVNDAFGNEY
jgi:hypothetical protein